ncbi:MAG: hypothetical protein C4K47_10490 [Candidatus Thorarchaeota archaeon]|nr:MAG: hypothetical protein C4K47_10490 [Candidatus Thorarchaeota archaeon]
MSWKKELIRLAEPADGRVPHAFKAHHAAVAVIMIGRQQPLGRYELCDNLSIGEGSARTLLKRLTVAEYTTADGKQGQKLTRKGLALFDQITRDIPLGLFLDVPRLVMYDYAYANIVKDRAQNVSDGIRQRDEAIIQGGYGKAGATTLKYREGVLTMPPGNFDILSEYGDEVALVIDSVKPEDGDAIVIGSAVDSNLAREVSMAAVITLFEVE